MSIVNEQAVETKKRLESRTKFAKVLKWFGELILVFAFLTLLISGATAISLIRNSDLSLLGFGYIFLYLARLILTELRWW